MKESNLNQNLKIVCFNPEKANNFAEAIEQNLLHETLEYTNF